MFSSSTSSSSGEDRRALLAHKDVKGVSRRKRDLRGRKAARVFWEDVQNPDAVLFVVFMLTLLLLIHLAAIWVHQNLAWVQAAAHSLCDKQACKNFVDFAHALSATH